jgi:UDP-2,3-diacylglucosamine pyrophosphatase LpxH
MSGKFKIVVSDLHLSAGRVAEGNPLEDFVSDQEFAAFLDGIAAESDREGADVELIVNGDAFEMLQVPHADEFDPQRIYPAEQYHSSSEEDSARKMALIVAGHRPFFQGLERFAQSGPPRRSVTFVKGNHDVNLHWPAVQDRIRQAMAATGDRAPLLAFEERRISREGIYVEHGNQYAEFVDRLEDMEEPHDHDDPDQLAIPLGSWFVMDVFNQVERDKYWIDGVKPITALVWYALAHDFAFAARAISTMVRALPGIIREGILAVDDTRADLVRQLEDPDQLPDLAARYEADEAFRSQFNAQVAHALSPPRATLATGAEPLAPVPDAEGKGKEIQERVRSSLHAIARLRAQEEGVKLVTFGHTHDAGVEQLKGDTHINSGTWKGGTYINSGTWTWRADFTGAGKETWRDLFRHPERFTDDRLLSYVRIDYDDAGQPTGQLLTHEPPEAPPVPPDFPLLPTFWERVRDWFRTVWGQITGGS